MCREYGKLTFKNLLKCKVEFIYILFRVRFYFDNGNIVYIIHMIFLSITLNGMTKFNNLVTYMYQEICNISITNEKYIFPLSLSTYPLKLWISLWIHNQKQLHWTVCSLHEVFWQLLCNSHSLELVIIFL